MVTDADTVARVESWDLEETDIDAPSPAWLLHARAERTR